MISSLRILVGDHLLASDEVASSTVGVAVLVGVSVNVSLGSDAGSGMGVSGDDVFFVVDMGHCFWLWVVFGRFPDN